MRTLRSRKVKINQDIACGVCGADNVNSVFVVIDGKKLFCFPCFVARYASLARQMFLWMDQRNIDERKYQDSGAGVANRLAPVQ